MHFWEHKNYIRNISSTMRSSNRMHAKCLFSEEADIFFSFSNCSQYSDWDVPTVKDAPEPFFHFTASSWISTETNYLWHLFSIHSSEYTGIHVVLGRMPFKLSSHNHWRIASSVATFLTECRWKTLNKLKTQKALWAVLALREVRGKSEIK